ncbi:PAP2 superfamily protein [Dyadobacter jejuensis]|uniref:PAP2 superfamily protein n=1 Tax=Dyadobacter jejuensis TaxID=1082580 RepID=A0A316ASM6_9BACT|nr:phosphatase PAP2 family protein [Dyadobacter jejuensis]PWJ59830.1 PAP2 superfamily protein [Dyadobacter jejuensis]
MPLIYQQTCALWRMLVLCLLATQLSFAQAPGDSTLWVVKPMDVIPPATLTLAGLLTKGKVSSRLNDGVYRQYPHFHTTADEYLTWAPGMVSLGLAASGVKGRHKLGDQLILAILSNVIAQGATQSLKRLVTEQRPNGADYQSFPSGHTTTAFANATILHQEYGQQSVLYSLGGYGTATAVGAMRIMNHHHWLSDVLVGAGIGIAATKVVYISYPWLQKKVRQIRKK